MRTVGGRNPRCGHAHTGGKIHRVGLPVKSPSDSAITRCGVTAKVPLTAGSWKSTVSPAAYLALTAATDPAIGPASTIRDTVPSSTAGLRASAVVIVQRGS